METAVGPRSSRGSSKRNRFIIFAAVIAVGVVLQYYSLGQLHLRMFSDGSSLISELPVDVPIDLQTVTKNVSKDLVKQEKQAENVTLASPNTTTTGRVSPIHPQADKNSSKDLSKQDNQEGNVILAPLVTTVSSNNTSTPGRPSLPILVMGLPETGTRTVHKFFNCGRYRSKFHMCHSTLQCGEMIHQNAVYGRPPLESLTEDPFPGIQVFSEMNAQGLGEQENECYFPQIELLDEFYRHYPHATWILTTRNVTNWLDSLAQNGQLRSEMKDCNITGFASGSDDFNAFYLGHVKRIRQFVEEHPSQKLVEVNVESADAGNLMEHEFGVARSCWDQASQMIKFQSCGCPQHCTKDIVNRKIPGIGKCVDRIAFFQNRRKVSEIEACEMVARDNFTAPICGACDPAKCAEERK